MIKVRVEVRNEIGSFTVAVRAENLRRAMLITRDIYPDSDVGISFPIEPDGFFGAGPHHDERVDLETQEKFGKREEPLEPGSVGADFSLCPEASLKV